MPLPGGSIDFSTVERFSDLAEGQYSGHIEYVRFKPAASEDKSDQLSICVESDEEETKGGRAWQNLYFTPKALYRMAEFFDLFGITSIDWDTGLSGEEPYDLLDPDLSGEPVVFDIVRDPKDYKGKPSYKTEVVEWLGGKTKPAAAAARAAQEPAEDKKPARPSAGARRPLR